MIIKIIYILSGAGLAVSAAMFKKIKNVKYLVPLLFMAMAWCFSFWGISTIFNSTEGYPPQWFFYITSLPVFTVSVLLVINIKK